LRSAKAPARFALVLGVLSLAAVPVGALASSLRPELTLLEAELVAVPVGLVLGLLALLLSRRARLRLVRSVRRTGEKLVRTARLVAWSGVYVCVTGGLALAFYGVLRASS
jgi:protein-S-isoprenylcysteine O-methyltransferase Ste14